jgi:hypothetical protein
MDTDLIFKDLFDEMHREKPRFTPYEKQLLDEALELWEATRRLSPEGQRLIHLLWSRINRGPKTSNKTK